MSGEFVSDEVTWVSVFCRVSLFRVNLCFRVSSVPAFRWCSAIVQPETQQQWCYYPGPHERERQAEEEVGHHVVAPPRPEAGAAHADPS